VTSINTNFCKCVVKKNLQKHKNWGILRKDSSGIVSGRVSPSSTIPSPGCADPSVEWRQWQFSEGGTAPNTGLLGKGPFDKWHMSFCQERRVGPWYMTVLRSWGNRLFGMECLSLLLSFTLSVPLSGFRTASKRSKCCICVRAREQAGCAFFFFCLLLHLTLFLSYCPLFFCSKRKRKQANEGKKGGGKNYVGERNIQVLKKKKPGSE